MEMGAADAYQHTDGNRNHDGCNLVHGVKEEEWDCQIWWSHFCLESAQIVAQRSWKIGRKVVPLHEILIIWFSALDAIKSS